MSELQPNPSTAREAAYVVALAAGELVLLIMNLTLMRIFSIRMHLILAMLSEAQQYLQKFRLRQVIEPAIETSQSQTK